MSWEQVYNPLGNSFLSTLLTAVPIVVLLGTPAFLRFKAHRAALLGLISALVIAVFVFGMPADKAGAMAAFSVAYGRAAFSLVRKA